MNHPQQDKHRVNLILGDCLKKMKEMPDNSVDSIVTDPPYHLVSIVKRFGKEGSAPAKEGKDGSFKRLSGGFMGKQWDGVNEDGIGIAQNQELWKECLRVLKPGGHLLAFSGTRTYHRMVGAIEDAGFEVRDMICWAYGQGFPKSLNVFKQLQKKCKCGNMDIYENRIKQVGNDSQKEAEYFLRFMQEADLSQTISSKKERGEVLQSGLSEQNTHKTMQGEEPKESVENGKEPSVEGRNNLQATEGELQGSNLCEMSERISSNGEERWLHNEAQIGDGSTPEQIINKNGSGASQRPQSEQQQYREPCAFCKQWGTQAIRTHGVGSALKPSIEPICFSRKPLEKGLSIAENCLKWGTGGINIDESRVGTEDNLNGGGYNTNGTSIKDLSDATSYATKVMDKEFVQPTGRFPANLIHDNSEEVRECFPETKTGGSGKLGTFRKAESPIEFTSPRTVTEKEYREPFEGNASRFFKSIIYQAKASKSERNKGLEDFEDKERVDYGGFHSEKGLIENNRNPENRLPTKNNHPTVKPIALMEYLIKMVTPKGGIVLDPFMGSGSTGVAAKKNGYDFIGIEKEEDYVKIAKARIENTPERLL